jgi:hypothetical protein
VATAAVAARVVPSATDVVRPVISRATAQMRVPAAEAEADDVEAEATVTTAASEAEAKLAIPVGVLGTSLGTVFKAASATTAAGL